MRQLTEFEDFYQANYGRIVALLLAVLGDRQEAEDAAQEAFARAVGPAGHAGQEERRARKSGGPGRAAGQEERARNIRYPRVPPDVVG